MMPKDANQLVVPWRMLHRAGFKPGDKLEFKVSAGAITIIRKLPTADDEYTPEQRRVIDACLAKADADIKAGRVQGPFPATRNSSLHCTKKQKGWPARKQSGRRNEMQASNRRM